MMSFVNFSFKHVEILIFLMELGKLEDVLPSPSFSIDILSLTNTNYETDESFDGFEQVDLNESVNREEKTYNEQKLNRFMRCSSQSHYKYRFPTAKTQDDFFPNCDNDVFIVPGNIYSKNNGASSEKENVGNYPSCNHYNNSIYVYMSSLSSEKDLHKYFRPCHSCKKTYCICVDVLASYNIPVLFLNSSERLQKKREENKTLLLDRQTISMTNLMKMNKAVETDVNITGFDGCGGECLSFRSSKLLNDKKNSECPDFESCRESSCQNSRTNLLASHNERKRNFCCQTVICDHSTYEHLDSGIDTKATFDLLREPCREDDPNQLLTWAPLLENVARNARNLVRDLELIMTSYKSENN